MAPTFSHDDKQHQFADLLSTIIVYVHGKLTDNSHYWAYLAMQPSMAKPFMDAQARGNFDLEEYGTIIEWGNGEKPPAEVVERMKQDYAADPDYEQKLLARLSQLKV